ncbi:hypothetical protein GIB67_025373 [Kingdonia uniflora]|uniref:Uncharacterized protein n=1 Tax=Kingdonia uniflora TaxID=39325 RepID=A0A7J7NBM6_9MAGN|nr:hypothetical protein GIB67_025373 [Kingdonia uniflora]
MGKKREVDHIYIGLQECSQMQLIGKAYAETYGENLMKSLEKDLSSDFERAILLWTMYPAERDVFFG